MDDLAEAVGNAGVNELPLNVDEPSDVAAVSYTCTGGANAGARYGRNLSAARPGQEHSQLSLNRSDDRTAAMGYASKSRAARGRLLG